MGLLRTARLSLEWWNKWKTLPIMPWVQAADLYRRGRLAEAEILYKKGLEKYSNHPAKTCVHLDLAHCLFKARKLKEAEDNLRRAIAANPEQREGYIRLARLQLWTGHATEAAWTLRRSFQFLQPDPEIAALYIFAALDATTAPYLLEEAVSYSKRIDTNLAHYPRLDTAFAKLALHKGDYQRGKDELVRLASIERAPFEAVISLAEILMAEGRIAHSRHHLHRALGVAPEHPKVLSLLAKSYLIKGEYYYPEFGVQLAERACQSTAWLSPREMLILAEAYQHQGDKMSALLVASRAKEEEGRVLGTRRRSKTLENLIDTLSSGTQG